jgi:hypothetical protein
MYNLAIHFIREWLHSYFIYEYLHTDAVSVSDCAKEDGRMIMNKELEFLNCLFNDDFNIKTM